MQENASLYEWLLPGTDAAVAAWYASLPERAGDDFALFEDEVVVVDVETTGLDPAREDLIEIAACVLSGNEVTAQFHTFVDPGRSIPAEIVELTGITDEDVFGAPDPSLAVELFAQFAAGRDLVAHNASFDQSFVMRQAEPGAISGQWLDSLALARIVLPRMKSHRLADLARAFGLHTPTHRAGDDIEATAQLWRILLVGVHSLPAGLAATIAGLSPLTEWSLRGVFSRAAIADAGHDFSLRRCRSERVTATLGSARADANECILQIPDAEEIEQAFSAAGVAGRMYDDYEPRPEQLDMALEVLDALTEGSHRVLEAGTGVGKSMAYLLPLALMAKRAGITMGVATKTNALMDQLVYHELPRLGAALDGLDYVALKGYEHYPCLRKVESLMRSDDEERPEVIEMLAMLLAYTAQTSWGDLDALNLHWAGLPRYEVEASSADCLKTKCPYFPNRCFLHGARRAARCSDIVVTNHALLFRDLEADGQILPPIRHWVIDEAHAVETEARRQMSYTVRARELETLLHRVSGGRNSCIAQIRSRADKLEGGSALYGITQDVEDRVLQISSIATSFWSFVKDLGAESAERRGGYDRITLWVGPELRASGAWATLENPGHSLSKKLGELVSRLRDVTSFVEQYEEIGSVAADLANTVGGLREAADALDLILSGEDDGYVYSVEIDLGTERAVETLSAERLDIGEALADGFYPEAMSVIFTSATLATGDEEDPFRYFTHGAGLDELEPDQVVCRQLASSYDFDRNMRVVLPRGIAEPNGRGYHSELAELLLEVHRAMGGSVLTLFTNRREMEELYRSLKPILHADGIELIAQTRGSSARSLRDRFLADRELSLFALRSFWEGFDAPGETLRCVVIPKLPFGRPTDPLARERELREGRAAWGRYSLPEAVMDLKQAAGRLIRNSTDSGFLVLADGRLQSRNYGRTFLNALPTSSIQVLTLEEMGELMRSWR